MTVQSGGITLTQAQDWLREKLREGAKCPCCTQYAQVYRRSVNAGMAVSLIKMYRAAGTDWCHVPTVIGGRSREEGKLRYWGLVEEATDQLRPDAGRAGYWRVTSRGVQFIHGASVPRYALVYDGRCLGHEGEPWHIQQALGTKFDLQKLLAGEA